MGMCINILIITITEVEIMPEKESGETLKARDKIQIYLNSTARKAVEDLHIGKENEQGVLLRCLYKEHLRERPGSRITHAIKAELGE